MKIQICKTKFKIFYNIVISQNFVVNDTNSSIIELVLVCTVRVQVLVILPIIFIMTKGRGDNKSNLTNVSPLGDDAKTIINSMNAQFSSLR